MRLSNSDRVTDQYNNVEIEVTDHTDSRTSSFPVRTHLWNRNDGWFL